MSKLDDLKRLREAKQSRGLRIESRPKKHGPIGDGIALTSMKSPPGLTEAIAEAIVSGKLSLKSKKGRPRIGEQSDKPWLKCKPPISERTWYRRQREKK
jgi:hypothetical protein